MACNSIAFSAATVDLADSVKDLDSNLVTEVIKAHLASLGYTTEVTNLGTITQINYYSAAGSGAYGVITYQHNGVTSSLAARSYYGPSKEEILSQVEAVVIGVAGLIAQEKLAQQVAALGWVESDFTTQDGTRVITLNV